jgi:hypothetical protein
VTTLPQSPWRVTVATVRAVTPETPGIATYDLSLDDPAVGYSFKPGQSVFAKAGRMGHEFLCPLSE